MYAAGHSLGEIMRKLFRLGTPRSLQTKGEADSAAVSPQSRPMDALMRPWKRMVVFGEAVHSSSAAEVLSQPFALAAIHPARAA